MSLQEDQIELLTMGLKFDICIGVEEERFIFIEGEEYSRNDLLLIKSGKDIGGDRTLFKTLTDKSREMVIDLLLTHV